MWIKDKVLYSLALPFRALLFIPVFLVGLLIPGSYYAEKTIEKNGSKVTRHECQIGLPKDLETNGLRSRHHVNINILDLKFEISTTRKVLFTIKNFKPSCKTILFGMEPELATSVVSIKKYSGR